MNSTQQITAEWLAASGLCGDDLLFEAFLRRGFLVFRNDEGIWLGSGSHWMDRAALQSIRGLDMEHVPGSRDRVAKISANPSGADDVLSVATKVIALGEHHVGEERGGFSTWGIGPFLHPTWERYCKMAWGCKLAVCPMERGRRRHSFGDDSSDSDFSRFERAGERDESPRVENALDLGIALLVKVFPLARVATSVSCDGHGVRPASIHLFFPWDVIWAKAVFAFLNVPTPNSRWNWTTDELTIEPLGGYSDAGVLAMLDDIQASARSLLNQDLIDKLGVAHSKLLETTGERFDDLAYFADEAGRQAQSLNAPSQTDTK